MKNFKSKFKNVLSKKSDLVNFVKDKGGKLTDTAKDLATHHKTESISNSMSERRISAEEIVNTATTNDGNISQNINLKGFMFEQEHARTFNESAAEQGSSLRAIVDPPNGVSGEPDIRIVDTTTGETVKTYQAKTGQDEYVIRSVDDPKYNDGQTDAFVINGESDIEMLSREIDKIQDGIDSLDYNNPESINNLNIEDNETSQGMEHDSIITHDNIESEVAYDFQMEEIATDPQAYSQELESSANSEEIGGGAVGGAAIAGIFQGINSSIKILAQIYRGEEVRQDVAIDALKNVMVAAASGAMRGGLIKVIGIILEKSMEDSGSLPVAIISITPIVYNTILEYLEGKISLEECIKEVGAKTLSRAMIVTMGILFPPLGIGLMGVSLTKTIWEEFDIANELKNNYPETECIFILACRAEVKKNELISSGKEHIAKTQEGTTKAIDYTKKKAEKTQKNINKYCSSTVCDAVENIQRLKKKCPKFPSNFGQIRQPE